MFHHFVKLALRGLRKKFLRAKHVPYITKTLKKAIMRRSQLETKYLTTKTETDLNLYKMKNFCSKLYTRQRRKYYKSLDTILDSEEFWKTMKPFLSDKNTIFSQISIEETRELYLMTLICL